LWTSKSRVAPVKKQSLPKLERCAAHLLDQLPNKVKGLFGERLIPSYLIRLTNSTPMDPAAAKWRFVTT